MFPHILEIFLVKGCSPVQGARAHWWQSNQRGWSPSVAVTDVIRMMNNIVPRTEVQVRPCCKFPEAGLLGQAIKSKIEFQFNLGGRGF